MSFTIWLHHLWVVRWTVLEDPSWSFLKHGEEGWPLYPKSQMSHMQGECHFRFSPQLVEPKRGGESQSKAILDDMIS